MNQLDIGNPANLTTPGGAPYQFYLPNRAVSNNLLRIINTSSSMLAFTFPGNSLQGIRVPPRSIRRVTLSKPESVMSSMQIISTDPTYVGTSDTIIEVYSADECDHPFEQSAQQSPGGNVASLALVNGSHLNWVANSGQPYPGQNDTPIDIFVPATGLYLLSLRFQVTDSNNFSQWNGTGTSGYQGADRLNWQFQNVTSGSGSGMLTINPESGTFWVNDDGGYPSPFPANAVGYQFGTYSIHQLLTPAFQGDEIKLSVSVAFSGGSWSGGINSVPYFADPSIQVWASVVMLAAA